MTIENFQKDLEQLINKYSKENESDTPDAKLNEYLKRLIDCIKTMNEKIEKREAWYERINAPVLNKNDHPVTNSVFKRTLEQFYTNTKVKKTEEKIKALRWYLDVFKNPDCKTDEEELKFLENTFNNVK